jgi:transglutaminase-like putative cysteine protease
VSHPEGWRVRIEHRTRFTYPAAARASYNEVRKIPLTTMRQTVLDAKIHTTPFAPQFGYGDYWGTEVVAFNVDAPHEQLTVESSALVDTNPGLEPQEATWADLFSVREQMAEWLIPSPSTRPTARIEAVARRVRQPTPLDTLRAVAGWVTDSLEYVPGVTSVRTGAEEALDAGRGVCQDFAHVALSLLRCGGIPARYVSGYFHPQADARIGEVAEAQSHAWIEAWLGDWWGFDPTNGVEIAQRHVLVARGRDYADVVPLKGVYAGPPPDGTEVRVLVTRML